MRYIALDTETTGLKIESGHKLIEIGCLEIIDRKLTGSKFHKYINPEREIDESATRVHGMKLSDLQRFPPFCEIADEFCEYIKNSTLIIHNAKFDLGFLNHELLNCGRSKIESLVEEIIDSLEIARSLHPGKKNSLDVLCSRYEVDNSQRDFHGALLDSNLLANVYLLMTRGQEKLDIKDQLNNSNNEYKFQGKKNEDFLVKYASPKEVEKHFLYLKKMKEDTNQEIIWREDFK